MIIPLSRRHKKGACMATSNAESSVATAGERKSQQQNAPNEYFYLFSQIDNTYRPYKTYFTTNIWTHILTTIVLFLFSIFFLCMDYL